VNIGKAKGGKRTKMFPCGLKNGFLKGKGRGWGEKRREGTHKEGKRMCDRRFGNQWGNVDTKKGREENGKKERKMFVVQVRANAVVVLKK